MNKIRSLRIQHHGSKRLFVVIDRENNSKQYDDPTEATLLRLEHITYQEEYKVTVPWFRNWLQTVWIEPRGE